MKFRLHELTVQCSNEKEVIPFTDFNYFHGPIGSGKTTIAKLIDFCLGGDFEPTPVLQPIFVEARLDLEINGKHLRLIRERDSGKVRALWDEGDDAFDLILPARKAGPVLIPRTEISVLSDLLFHLSGIEPPRVRKSKLKEDTDLIRLSIRDLLWYCYLDQDSMDSSFFNLDINSNIFERLKSLDVLRFIVGFHQEKVSELEAEIQNIKLQRLRCEAKVEAIREAFSEEQLSTAIDLKLLLDKLNLELTVIREELVQARRLMDKVRSHAVDRLQAQGRDFASELNEVNNAIAELQESIERDKSHKNTVRHLSLRQKRALTARNELIGLSFDNCPQCFNKLPSRESDLCPVCGQSHSLENKSALDEGSIDLDAKARADELEERIKLQNKALERLKRQRAELEGEKGQIDYDLNQALKNYDSAYLSTNLDLEKRQARLAQKIADLKRLQVLSDKIESLQSEVLDLEKNETQVRVELKHERALAEKDQGSIKLLAELFLDCLLRSRINGINPDDKVTIHAPHFLPEVEGKDCGNMVTTTFANISSGGKKNLFKCCFAIAIHRLAVRNKVLLPEFLMIDSPMKNISERVNNDEFVEFNEMLYELAAGELKGTQFIILDKEYFPPKESRLFKLNERYMTPNDAKNPPLLRSHVSVQAQGSNLKGELE